MALTRDQVLDAAMATLDEYGLASLSMRSLAKRLGVQPGALYWHVKNKQELLALVAERILARVLPPEAPGTDALAEARDTALAVRTALLAVRDGAEIVSLVHALDPGGLPPLRGLEAILAHRLPPQQAGWAARATTHYVLGAVAEEQNHTELVRAGVVPPDSRPEDAADAFRFGLDAILEGLRALTPPPDAEPT